MKLNRIDLKKVMYDFNNIANRYMRVDWQEYNVILSKFLAHIENTEIIIEYVKDCGAASIDIEKEINEASISFRRSYFHLGDTEQQEVANIYHILKYCSDNNINVVQTIARSYSSTSDFQDMVKGFNERVSMVLIRYIEGYLTKIGIDMGMDERISYSITVNNGQVNLASDAAIINATQNNGIDIPQLKTLIKAIRNEAVKELSKEDRESVNESLEVIESELSQQKPRKNFLKTAIIGLQAIKGTAEFGAAVITLVQFAQSFL